MHVLFHKVGDIVKIFMRKRQDGSLVTSVGTVTHVRPDRRVKTDICSNYFRPVLRTITRLPTSILQPEVTCIEELSQFGMVDTDVEDDSPVISSDLSGLRVGGGVSER